MTVAQWCEYMIALLPKLASIASSAPMMVLLGVTVIGVIIGIIFYLTGD